MAPLPDGHPALTISLVPCTVDTFNSNFSRETAPVSQQVISVSRVSEKKSAAETCNSSGMWVFNFVNFQQFILNLLFNVYCGNLSV